MQKFIEAVCPTCKKQIRLSGNRWVRRSVVSQESLPEKTKEDNCPECVVEMTRMMGMGLA